MKVTLLASADLLAMDFGSKGDNILLIAGGVGAAPLSPLAEKASLQGFKVTTLLGAKTKEELVFRERFESAGKVMVATDDGIGRKTRICYPINRQERLRPDILLRPGNYDEKSPG